MIVRHVESAFDREPPFSSEVTFRAGFRLGGNERHEVVAFADLLADLLIPRLAATELALVVPNFETQRAQRIAKGSRGLAIPRGIAQEQGRRRTRGWRVAFSH